MQGVARTVVKKQIDDLLYQAYETELGGSWQQVSEEDVVDCWGSG